MRRKWVVVGLVVLAVIAAVAVVVVACGRECGREEREEARLTIEQLPPAVAAAIQREAGDATIKVIVQKTDRVYEAELARDGWERDLWVDSDGKVVAEPDAEGEEGEGEAGGEGDERGGRPAAGEAETELTLDQLPPAAAATIKREAAGATINVIVRKTDRVYEAELLRDGRETDLWVDADGQVVAEPDAAAGGDRSAGGQGGWQETFTVDKSKLQATGRNPYFVLVPGHQVTLAGREGTNEVQVVMTVLDATEVVDGVTCRVLEERETKNGKLVEVSRNFYAIDPATRDVYYFGEDVDNYGPDGRVKDHHSAWRSGINGARFGLMMPGAPAVGQKYYQEQAAADEAMDRAAHTSITGTLETPAGRYERVLEVEETSPLESGVSPKAWAPGVGLVRDGSLLAAKVRPAR